MRSGSALVIDLKEHSSDYDRSLNVGPVPRL